VFAVTLLGEALFNGRTLHVALVGVCTITLYKMAFSPFTAGARLAGFGAHLTQEWVVLVNLLLLLLGFALLANHFEQSEIPAI
jgi:uncharacterized membrane protein